MKFTDPLLQRLFTLAGHHEPTPPASDLEERILADWRQGRLALRVGVGPIRELRIALFGACAVLALTCAIAFPILKGPTDPSVMLTNFALQSGLSHE